MLHLQGTGLRRRRNLHIAGLVLEPLPTGAWAFLAVTTAVFTKVLTFPQAFGAFTNDVIWLIVVSFFFAAVCCSPLLERRALEQNSC